MWWNFQDSTLDKTALKLWPGFAAQAGLSRHGWRLTKLSRRDDPENSRIVLRAKHRSGLSYAYKFQLKPESQQGFVAHHMRQERAFHALGEDATLTAPKPIHVSQDAQTSLFEYIRGHTFAELVRKAEGRPVQQLDLLKQAGVWLDAYHRTQIEERRIFQPKYTVCYYQELEKQITAGIATVPARQLFLAGIRRIIELAPQFEGQQTISAIQHGDFHLFNLIRDDQRTLGLDFSSDQMAPVGHDISKVLLDFTTLTRSANEVAPGRVVPEDVTSAFFEGYKMVGPNDPSLAFLLYPRVLSTLARVPQKKALRTEAKQRTLRRLRPFAKRAFQPDHFTN